MDLTVFVLKMFNDLNFFVFKSNEVKENKL